MLFPHNNSYHRINVNQKWGGMIDAAMVANRNCIYGGAGAAFQMACFDGVILPKPWCGDSQGGQRNPTQSGSCGIGSRISGAINDLTIHPRFFEKDAESELVWRQVLTPIRNNLIMVEYQNLVGGKGYPDAHGRYTAFLVQGFTDILTSSGLKTRLKVDGVNNPITSKRWLLIENPEQNLAFGLIRETMNDVWAVQVNWFATLFGQAEEYKNFNNQITDKFSFIFGQIKDTEMEITAL